MNTGIADLAVLAYTVAGLVQLGLAVFLLSSRRLREAAGAPYFLLAAAVLASALWCTAEALNALSHSVWPAYAAAALDLLRYALWFVFLQALLDGGWLGQTLRGKSKLGVLVSLVVLASAAVLLARILQGEYRPDAWSLATALALALSVLGVLLTEQLFRNLPEDSRWNAKPVCLGLAFVFAFDILHHSEAMLFGSYDADARVIRGLVHALAVPLLLVAAMRRGNFVRSLQVSRTAAFYSASLLLVGAYMLFMAITGYYVRFFGGEWGRALQLGVLFGAALLLLVLAFSSSWRARLRVFVGKHFFSYRYDYRQEWLRFTAKLSAAVSPEQVGQQVIRALADMVECPGGGLWTRRAGAVAFGQAAVWNATRVNELEDTGSHFVSFLHEKGWVIDLEEYRNAPRRYGELALPNWLLSDAQAWLVVPMQVGDELTGFVTLNRPRTDVELNWEVRDLLRTAGRQAAGHIAQMQATEALLEARKFDAFNRMSAFVVHDLKNIVTQLSLMLKNAERLHDNREFQQDMLLTVESSLEKMRRLMLQLREGATPPGGALGVELAPIVHRLASAARARGRRLEVTMHAGLSTRGHDERLERVLGHLVQNAFDATPNDGRVWLDVDRFGGLVKVEIGDTGAGMSEDFINTRLFRPFSSTKAAGMGIGTYESAQYIQELGGSIKVRSQLGQGTLLTILLPLFDGERVTELPAGASS